MAPYRQWLTEFRLLWSLGNVLRHGSQHVQKMPFKNLFLRNIVMPDMFNRASILFLDLVF